MLYLVVKWNLGSESRECAKSGNNGNADGTRLLCGDKNVHGEIKGWLGIEPMGVITNRQGVRDGLGTRK